MLPTFSEFSLLESILAEQCTCHREWRVRMIGQNSPKLTVSPQSPRPHGRALLLGPLPACSPP